MILMNDSDMGSSTAGISVRVHEMSDILSVGLSQ